MVTDPCYFIRGALWDELCKIWYENEVGKQLNLADVCVVRIKGATILISTTAHGDGTYSVTGNGSFGVDAGCMAVVQVGDLDKAGFAQVAEGSAVYVTLDKPGMVFADGEGSFTGAIKVQTEGSDEEDEEYLADLRDDDPAPGVPR